MTRFLFGAVAALAAVAAGVGTAPAAYYSEVGDAGQLLGTSQAAIGAGAFQGVTGSINPGNDVDLYLIYISNAAAFSASTVGTPGTLNDTQLFLFDAGGFGVVANDDLDTLVTLRSSIPAGSGFVTAPGFYYLAISSFDTNPVSAGGSIFPNTFTGVFGPTGPGGGQALSGWSGSGSTGTYQIDIAGAEFVNTVPAPAGVVLGAVGFATVGLGRLVRRRKVAA